MVGTGVIRTARLTLTPLDQLDAVPMVGVLADPALYTFTGGDPPTVEELTERYRFQSSGSPRDTETWHNWIIRLDGNAIGQVQATVIGDAADLAWIVGIRWQGRGYADGSGCGDAPAVGGRGSGALQRTHSPRSCCVRKSCDSPRFDGHRQNGRRRRDDLGITSRRLLPALLRDHGRLPPCR